MSMMDDVNSKISTNSIWSETISQSITPDRGRRIVLMIESKGCDGVSVRAW